MKSVLTYLIGLCSMCALIACHDEVVPLVGFEVSSGKAHENDSTYTVRINLGKSTNGTTINFNIAGTAALDGDFFLTQQISTDTIGPIRIYPVSDSVSVTQLTVPPGQSYAELSFKLIDDSFVEPNNETIYFIISGISDEGINSSLKNYVYKFVIEDNDIPPADGLQVDLSWSLGNGISINQADFDLYLARNVTLKSNGEIESKEIVSNISSVHTKGFETFKISNAVADDEYYVLVRYTSGGVAANLNLILSKDRSYTRASGKASTTSVGKDFYYGPITKSGDKYSRMAASAEGPHWIYPD